MTEKRGGYGQFCSIAMASEILCTRWTMLLLRELLAGSTRFNALRKGLPRMSPALLSKRLRELENSGVITCTRSNDQGGGEYRLTSAGAELGLVVESIGRWGQRWVEGQLSMRNLDASLLMWDMRRNLNLTPIPDRRLGDTVYVPRITSFQAGLVAVDQRWRGGPLLHRSRFGGRSLCGHGSSHDDRDLDGGFNRR